jgi:phage shock protein C
VSENRLQHKRRTEIVMTQKRLYRSTQDRMFAGVCGGIAEYLEVDPTLVRLVFVALSLMGGPGLIIYIVMMLLVPETPRQTWNEKAKHVPSEDSVVQSSIPVPPDDLASEPDAPDDQG